MIHIHRLALGACLALGLAPVAASAQDADPITFAIGPQGPFEGIILAQEQGFFEEAGVSVEFVDASAPAQNIARLLSGEIDVTGSGIAPVLSAVASGVPIKVIFNSETIGEPRAVGLLVLADSPYQSIGDLVGEAVGVMGTQGNGGILVKRALAAEGLDPDAIELVNMPVNTHLDNLRNGNVAAVVPFSLFYDMASAQPDIRVIDEAYAALEGMPGTVYIASDRVIAERGEDLQKMIGAIERGFAYANENPDAVRAVDADRTQMPPEYIQNRTLPTADITVTTASIEALAEDMAAFGFASRAPTLDEVVWENAPTE